MTKPAIEVTNKEGEQETLADFVENVGVATKIVDYIPISDNRKTYKTEKLQQVYHKSTKKIQKNLHKTSQQKLDLKKKKQTNSQAATIVAAPTVEVNARPSAQFGMPVASRVHELCLWVLVLGVGIHKCSGSKMVKKHPKKAVKSTNTFKKKVEKQCLTGFKGAILDFLALFNCCYSSWRGFYW